MKHASTEKKSFSENNSFLLEFSMRIKRALFPRMYEKTINELLKRKDFMRFITYQFV